MPYINEINKYISSFPESTQKQLKALRTIVTKTAPKCEEVISYGMPAIKQNKVLVYYAAYKNHIGFYPTSQPIIFFKEKLENFKTSKGAIQFPIDKPLPTRLIASIIRYRMKQDALTKSNK